MPAYASQSWALVDMNEWALLSLQQMYNEIRPVHNQNQNFLIINLIMKLAYYASNIFYII